MPFFFLFFLFVACWFFFCRFRTYERPAGERAKDILAERYARGEISAEEYRERHEQIH